MTSNPVTPPPDSDAILAELTALPQWLLWKLEDRGGEKPTKVPYQTNGQMASSTESDTWTTFDRVVQTLMASKTYDGFGFAITAPYCGIDLDHCRDKATGAIEAWALDIIERLDSYTEQSPSGTGVHIWVRGRLPLGRRRKGRVEMYDSARYFTVSARPIDGTRSTIEDRQAELEALHASLFAATLPSTPASVIPLRNTSRYPDDVELVAWARTWKNGPKFIRLYDYGDTSEYATPDNAGHSEADQALANLLATLTGKDADRMDRLFRSSALMRDKWDSKRADSTYGANTIKNAIAFVSDFSPDMPSSSSPVVTVGRRGAAARATFDTSVPPFPVEDLPASFADFTREGAASKGCPVEFYAVPLLVAAGAAIGNSYELALKDDFIQGSNLYSAVVGNPGTGKSPAMKDVVRPLELAQMARFKTYERAMAAYEEALQEREERRKGEKGERPVEPVMRDLLTTNATVEALVMMLGRHSGLLLFADELSGLLLGMNQYKGGKGSDRQFYLTAWSRGFLSNHRKKAGDTTIVDAPHLSILGGIQPDLLKEMQVEGNDGFLDRFIWAMPDTKASRWSTEVVASETKDRVQDVINRLLDASEQEPQRVRPSLDAQAIWVEWYDALSEQMDGEQLPIRLIGPWAKLSAHAARIALILHACEDGGTVMSADVMARALRIADCLAAHTRRVYAELSASQRSLEMKILEAIPPQGRIQHAVLLRKVLHGHVRTGPLKEALDTLKEAGALAEETEETAGRPARYWRRL